jgi:hypothetical protein
MSDPVKRRKTLRRILAVFAVIVAALALTIGLLFLEENWRARTAWERCRQELTSQGEKLDASSFIPPPVPDAENLAMAPLLAPLNDYVKDPKSGAEVPRDPAAVEQLKSVNLTKLNVHSKPMPLLGGWQLGKRTRLEDWQDWLLDTPPRNAMPSGQAGKDVLAALDKYSAQLAEFSVAAQRPLARFPLQYEKGFAIPIRHSAVLMGFAGVYRLRALAELETGDSEAAFRDVKTLDRIAAALQPEPLLISHLVRTSVISYVPQVLWEGIAQHRWSEDQLKTMQQMLSGIDLIADHQRVVRGERGLLNSYYDKLREKHSPRSAMIPEASGIQDLRPRSEWWVLNILPQNALLYQNQVWQNRWLQELVLPVFDASTGRVYPRRQAAAEEIQRQTQTTPYNFLAKLALPVYPSISMRTAATEVVLREAIVACALERFRLKRGGYPETLRELLPDYLSQPVQDIFSDEALLYRREGGGSYILYSVGWNATDDGGAVATEPGTPNRRDDRDGDWVWFGGDRP